jgi:antitoxin component YwqK of YwqJK toxin-antitoxin module
MKKEIMTLKYNDILYEIGTKIHNPKSFFNFIVSFKSIKNKERLIEEKKEEFRKEIEPIDYLTTKYIFPNKEFYLNEELYEDNNKQLYLQIEYHNDNRNGIYKEWYITGRLHKKYRYLNDELYGKCEEWYEEGQPYINCYYLNDKKHMLYQKWYNNKQLHVSCKYVNGEKQGLYHV